MNKDTLWKAILGELKISASNADVKTFFPLISAEKFEGGIFTLSCKSPIVKERIENRYYNQIKNVAEKIVKKRVELAINVIPFEVKKEEPKNDIGPLFTKKAAGGDAPFKNGEESGLLTKYTFETFIVGSNNRLAHTIAQAVADNPGKAYNPFFLYSDVGLGKTHLLHAIGNNVLKKFPDQKVLYCTGESFTNELLESLSMVKTQRNTLTKFKAKFRKTDVLLIDDVQFIAGKDSTQEEFFHAFNTLYMAGKQVVLTSDKHPNEIKKLEKRLSSRFSSGMIADMQMPDSDVRSAILRSKRNALKITIPNEVCDFIAQNTETNIRELEGIFTQIIAQIQALNQPIDLDAVSQIMGKSKKEIIISTAEILKATANYYSVRISDLKGPRRMKEIVFPRQVAMYLTRTLTDFSLNDVGNIFGGRDHSTVLHSVEKIEEEEQEYPKVKQDIVNIKTTLGII